MSVERDTIRDVVAAHVPVPPTEADPLSLTSLDLVVIASDLERRFSVRIAASELRPENFRSIEAIAAFIRRKRAGPAAEGSGAGGGEA